MKPPLLPKPQNVAPRSPGDKPDTNPFRRTHQSEPPTEPNANVVGNGTNPFHATNRRSTNPFDCSATESQPLHPAEANNNNFDLLLAEKVQHHQHVQLQPYQQLQHQQQLHQELEQHVQLRQYKQQLHLEQHEQHQHLEQHQQHFQLHLRHQQKHSHQLNQRLEQLQLQQLELRQSQEQPTSDAGEYRQTEDEGKARVADSGSISLGLQQQGRLSLSVVTANLVASFDDIHRQFNSDKECLIERDCSSYSRCVKKQAEPELARSNRSSWRSNSSDLENGCDGSLSRSSSLAENDHSWLKVSPRSSGSSGSSPVVKIKITDVERPTESVSIDDEENGSLESSYSVRRRIKTWFGSFGKGNRSSKRRDSTFYVEEEAAGKMWDRASVSSGEERPQPADEECDKEPEENGQPLSERERKERKAFLVIQEVISSEKVFIGVLKLLGEDFVQYVKGVDAENAVIAEAELNKIIGTLPQLRIFNEALLEDLEERFANWSLEPRIADVIVKKGPYLKLFSTYIQNFEKQCCYLDDFCHKYSRFGKAVKDFEALERCKKLTLKHYMLKPVQRLPQYRLLLEEYLSNQYPDSIDYENTQQALKIVCEVAEHANRKVEQGVNNVLFDHFLRR